MRVCVCVHSMSTVFQVQRLAGLLPALISFLARATKANCALCSLCVSQVIELQRYEGLYKEVMMRADRSEADVAYMQVGVEFDCEMLWLGASPRVILYVLRRACKEI